MNLFPPIIYIFILKNQSKSGLPPPSQRKKRSDTEMIKGYGKKKKTFSPKSKTQVFKVHKYILTPQLSHSIQMHHYKA